MDNWSHHLRLNIWRHGFTASDFGNEIQDAIAAKLSLSSEIVEIVHELSDLFNAPNGLKNCKLQFANNNECSSLWLHFSGSSFT